MDKEILDILKAMQSDMKEMKVDMNSMHGEMNSIKTTQNEHTQILRALEHKTDVIAAEQENMKHDVAEIKGEVKSMRKDMSSVEIITANNWSDIAKLKAIK
ncbi:hypothetical protein [Clostridium sp.]|uniref:hypothetical protein n=1 Tax=Clostridium sp. TaxID=1506 RepID=UPI003D6C82D3